MKSVSLKLPDAVAAQLEALAKRRGASKSEVIRDALAVYLSSNQPNLPGSFLELAKDLVGIVDGPPDLSTNPQYMEGFGR